MSASRRELYEVPDRPLVAVRVPLLSLKTITDLYAAIDVHAALRDLLDGSPLIRQAIRIASPSLADATDTWRLQGKPPKETVPLRVLAYIARMASRTTPLGICAGVGLADAGPKTDLSVDLEHRQTRTRADMQLLAELVKALETGEHRGKIRYRANEAVLRRGGRLYVANVLLTNQRSHRADQRPVTLKETRAVAFVRDFAVIPRSYEEMSEALAAEFGEPLPQAHRVLDALIESGVLLSELQASPIGDPIAHLMQRLGEVDADLASRMRGARVQSAAFDAQPFAARSEQEYAQVLDAHAALVEKPPKAVAQVDMLSPCAGTLGSGVLSDAARLGDYFLRMGCDQALSSFRQRFTDRYGGRERMVPILELVDENLGLGNVGEIENVEIASPEREALIMNIACDAMRRGSDEIVLSDEQLEIIAPLLNARTLVPPIELSFQVAAASREAVDSGEYLIAPSGFVAAMGRARSFGRFADLLGPEARDRVRDTVTCNQGGALRAEFVFAPASGRTYNVFIRPRFLDTELQVGVFDDSDVDRLSLDDLWVGLDGERFFVWSASRERRVELVESHVFNTHIFAPNLCRLISLLSLDGTRTIRGFPWGGGFSLTALPRVRYGRIVLSLRRWSFAARPFAENAQAALDTVRKEWNVPRFVFLCDGDNRLLLDLDSPIVGLLLEDQLQDNARGKLILQEMFPAPDQLWLPDASGDTYVAEFVAALEPRVESVREELREAPALVAQRRRHGPGSDWVYVKMYAGAQALEDLLLGSIAPLISAWRERESIDRWFFVRYADPEDHLRVRVRATRNHAAQLRDELLGTLEGLLDDARISRYTLDTYDPEYERYGGVDAMNAVERFFTIDSDTCLEYFRRPERTTDARIAMAAESFFLWILENDRLMDLTSESFAAVAQRKLERRDREALKRLGDVIANGLPRAGIGDALEGALSGARLRSLFHMHCNRLGLVAFAEERAAVLLRAMIVSRRARGRHAILPERSTPGDRALSLTRQE
jgi:lantibiotic biosynthesis protein